MAVWIAQEENIGRRRRQFTRRRLVVVGSTVSGDLRRFGGMLTRGGVNHRHQARVRLRARIRRAARARAASSIVPWPERRCAPCPPRPVAAALRSAPFGDEDGERRRCKRGLGSASGREALLDVARAARRRPPGVAARRRARLSLSALSEGDAEAWQLRELPDSAAMMVE